MSAPTHVLLVDDHAIVREGLRALLEQIESLRIVGEAADSTEALELTRRLRPDVVLMDLKMPGLPAADAIRTIRAQYPATQVLVLTSYAEDRQVEEVLRAGALGYVLKNIAAADLVRAIATVAGGKVWLQAEAQSSLVNRMRRPADLEPARPFDRSRAFGAPPPREGHEQPGHRPRSASDRRHGEGLREQPARETQARGSHAGRAARGTARRGPG